MTTSPSGEPVAIVMAAGKSTRMKSDKPKVLHDLCGQPLLAYVLAALDEAGIHRKIVVVGFGAEQVQAAFANAPGVEFALQAEQKGTGHAVMVCRDQLGDHRGPVVVLAGDGPMLRAEMISKMLERMRETKSKAFMATAKVADPTGLGRIVRDTNGRFLRIVEHKDASPEIREIKEINASFYVFDGPALFDALEAVKPNNVQGEYYVTDVPEILREGGEIVTAEILADEIDMFGINHRRHLADAHALMQQRIQNRLLDDGVTIVDSRNTYIDARAKIGRDTIIFPFSVIRGPVQIGSRCKIGPFAHVREETELADDVQVGAFVEVVRSKLGNATVAKHLAYVGDAIMGAGVNVGAGVVTANYEDGVKSHTRVDDNAFLGSGAVLVAPVAIGPDAIVGAGAVLPKNHDVQPGELVFGVPARPMKRKSRPKK
ncbi:MAG: NTP transferase domain-containing protein [Planctomycetota bacterium]